MALIIEIKRGETVYTRGCIIFNDGANQHVAFVDDAPMLREKDYLKKEHANTPARTLYFLVQSAFLADERTEPLQAFRDNAAHLKSSRTDWAALIEQIEHLVMEGKFYRALQATLVLIKLEPPQGVPRQQLVA